MGSGVCWGSPTADVAIPGEGSPPLGLQPCQPLSAAGAGGDVGAAPPNRCPPDPVPCGLPRVLPLRSAGHRHTTRCAVPVTFAALRCFTL